MFCSAENIMATADLGYWGMEYTDARSLLFYVTYVTS